MANSTDPFGKKYFWRADFDSARCNVECGSTGSGTRQVQPYTVCGARVE